MECPYCAEQVKDTALVCAHCTRDLTFFKPVMVRLDALEKHIADVEDSLEAQPLAEDHRAVPRRSWRVPILAVLVTTLIAVSSYWASLPEATSGPLLLISIFCPLPISMWVGLITTHKVKSEGGSELSTQLGVASYLLLGLAAGFLTFGSMALLIWARHLGVFTSDFWAAALIWIAGSAALFVGGGLVGRWLRRKGARTTPSRWLYEPETLSEGWLAVRADASLRISGTTCLGSLCMHLFRATRRRESTQQHSRNIVLVRGVRWHY